MRLTTDQSDFVNFAKLPGGSCERITGSGDLAIPDARNDSFGSGALRIVPLQKLPRAKQCNRSPHFLEALPPNPAWKSGYLEATTLKADPHILSHLAPGP